ncbi:fimbrial protein [Serratia aquatilis]|uniref:Fimbrial protein n=1 Tax=Serratia aquatilis TaxID=1737515 RepID=A0ABV6EK64_9GAMM
MKKLLLSLLMTTYSVIGYSADLTLSPPTIQYTNPADAVTDFNLLTGTWNATGSQARFCEYSSNMNKAVIESSSPLSGYTAQIDGVTYSIFASNMPGIGWVMGAKDTNAASWTPLTDTQKTVYPFATGQTGSISLGANVRFAFVKLPGSLGVGAMAFPQQKIADFKCYRSTSILTAQAAIYVNSTTINVNALACQVATAKNVSIPLGEFSPEELPPVNGNFGEYSTAVELSCDSGVTPWMTVSDASNSANTSNIIQLTPDSTAQGVGVQVFYNNEAIAKSLGLDSSSKNNPNQFQVGGKTTMAAQQVSVPLSFRYIRTQQSVTPGNANAAATVTFSYQ